MGGGLYIPPRGASGVWKRKKKKNKYYLFIVSLIENIYVTVRTRENQ
jgi:hypothetical protein